MKKNITISDIAGELAIDPSTVSRALKDHPEISESTKKRVRKKATQLGYSANHIASALAQGQSNVVGVIVPRADESFFAKTIRGIEEKLMNNGYRTVITQSHDTVDGEKSCIKTMIEERVDGILASHAMQASDIDHYRPILDKEITLILFDRFNETLDTPVVAIDDFKGAYRTMEHLIEQGCKRIAFIGGSRHVHIYNERFKGYRQALVDHDLKFDETMVFDGDMKLESARTFTEKLLQAAPTPDAIFSANDHSAMGAIQVVKEHGISIPGEMAVAGFSNEEFSSFITPSLTSTKQHGEEMGRLAAQLFLNHINDDNTIAISQKIMVPTELVIRESTRRKQQ